MRNWTKWNAERAQRSARATRAANARWEAARAERAAGPTRQTRIVELTIRDTHRTMRTIRLSAEPTELGWSRWAAAENGQRIGRRRLGKTRLARMIAETL